MGLMKDLGFTVANHYMYCLNANTGRYSQEVLRQIIQTESLITSKTLQTCRCLVRDKELQHRTKSVSVLSFCRALSHIRGNASVLPCLTLNKTSNGMKLQALDKYTPTHIPDTACKALSLSHMLF